MKKTHTTIFLLRHGEAEQNVLHILNSLSDGERFGLTEEGRLCVKKTSEELQLAMINVIFSSPLRRTKETAEILREVTGAEIIFDDRLRETDFGAWSGRSSDEFWDHYPNLLSRLDGDDEFQLEGFRAVRERVGLFIQEILERYWGEHIVIVSHGDILEQLHGILTNTDIVATLSGWYPEKGIAKKIVIGTDFLENFFERERALRLVHSSELFLAHPVRK